jgi:hypothetical protein
MFLSTQGRQGILREKIRGRFSAYEPSQFIAAKEEFTLDVASYRITVPHGHIGMELRIDFLQLSLPFTG